VHTDEADEERRERKALRFVGITFFCLAAYVGYEAVTKLIGHKIPEESIPGIVIAVLSVIIMPSLGLKKQKIAKQMGSRALEADAMETLVCAYLSVTLLIGLGLNAWLGWWWADPVAALAMLPLILKEGWEALEGEKEGGSQRDV
jgi:divalent metal cation (Fe/Co/Zn/Cd) transporter